MTRHLLILLLFCASCFGQAVVPNRRKNFQPVASGGGGGGATAPVLFSYTKTNSASAVTTLTILSANISLPGAGNNTYGIVDVSALTGVGQATSVTWNGVSMTNIGDCGAMAAGNGIQRKYGLGSPTAGNIVATFPNSSQYNLASASVYTNVGSIGTTNFTLNSASAGITNTISCATTQVWQDSFWWAPGFASLSHYGSQQTIYQTNIDPAVVVTMANSTTVGLAGGNVTNEWTLSSANAYGSGWLGVQLNGH